MSEECLVEVEVRLLAVDEHPAEVLERPAIAVILLVLAGELPLREVEVLLHQKGHVDRSDREEEPRAVGLHLLHQRPAPLHEAQDQLQGHHAPAAEIGLGTDSLEPQAQPLLPRGLLPRGPLSLRLEVLGVEGAQQVPALLLLEEDVGLLLQRQQLLELELGQRVVLAEHALSPVPARRVGLRLGGQQRGLRRQLPDLYALLSIHYQSNNRSQQGSAEREEVGLLVRFSERSQGLLLRMFEEAKEGRLWGKGSGSSGVLNKTFQDEQNFVPLALDFPVSQLSLSSSFQLALSKEELYVWGVLDSQAVPRPLKTLTAVKQISCGWEHALMATHNRLFGLGSNAYQQLGFSSSEKFWPNIVEIILEEVSFIAAGFRQSYIVLQNGLRGCGESKKYELGKAAKKPSLWHVLSQQLDMLQGKIVQIACGKRFLMLLTDRNEVYAYGCNEENSFNAKVPYFDRPTLVYSGIRQFVCGWAHVTLLKLDGSVESYGRNNLGQLGHGKETEKIAFELENGEEISRLSSGSEFTFAVTSRHRLYGWGWNEHYNILPSEEKIILQPILVPIPEKCSQVWTNPALTIMKTTP